MMACCTLIGLDKYARKRGMSVRLELEPAGPVAHDCVRLSRLAVYNGRGRNASEVDAVDFPLKTETSVDEAAALLYEYLQRTKTED